MGFNVPIGEGYIGSGWPCYIVAEGGINHSGDLDTACRMIRAAHEAGADAIKWQKREPEVCVPRDQWEVVRDTPWGPLTYIDYRKRLEFGKVEYDALDAECRRLGIDWFAGSSQGCGAD